jgi:hypothetical protein
MCRHYVARGACHARDGPSGNQKIFLQKKTSLFLGKK